MPFFLTVYNTLNKINIHLITVAFYSVVNGCNYIAPGTNSLGHLLSVTYLFSPLKCFVSSTCYYIIWILVCASGPNIALFLCENNSSSLNSYLLISFCDGRNVAFTFTYQTKWSCALSVRPLPLVLPPVLVPRHSEYPNVGSVTSSSPTGAPCGGSGNTTGGAGRPVSGLNMFSQTTEPSMPYNVSYPQGFSSSPTGMSSSRSLNDSGVVPSMSSPNSGRFFWCVGAICGHELLIFLCCSILPLFSRILLRLLEQINDQYFIDWWWRCPNQYSKQLRVH